MLTKHSLTIEFNCDLDLPGGTIITEAFGFTTEETNDQHKKLANEFMCGTKEKNLLRFFIQKLLDGKIDGSFLILLATAHFGAPINQAIEELANILRSIKGEN
jgi:hypothetical protein